MFELWHALYATHSPSEEFTQRFWSAHIIFYISSNEITATCEENLSTRNAQYYKTEISLTVSDGWGKLSMSSGMSRLAT